MTLPAAVHIQYRPFGFTFLAFPAAFHKHSDWNQDQTDHHDGGKEDVSKYPVVWIIMTGKQRLDKENNDEDEAVNGKDSPNDADPIGNRFWHFHIGNDLSIYWLCGNPEFSGFFGFFLLICLILISWMTA